MPTPKLILASGSPRRRELLTEAGYTFEVVVPSESAEDLSGETAVAADVDLSRLVPAARWVARLAWQKAVDVAERTTSGVLIACDTVAECDGHILGKPEDRDDARRMLKHLSGREHHVYSGLCVWRLPDGRPDLRVATTTLRMDALTDDALEDYLASGAWQGKAGAFGYQDRLGWVHVVAGSQSNVVGLPMELLAEMLALKPL